MNKTMEHTFEIEITGNFQEGDAARCGEVECRHGIPMFGRRTWHQLGTPNWFNTETLLKFNPSTTFWRKVTATGLPSEIDGKEVESWALVTDEYSQANDAWVHCETYKFCSLATGGHKAFGLAPDIRLRPTFKEAKEEIPFNPSQYQPWVFFGMTELEYCKKMFLAKSQEAQLLEDALRRVVKWQAHSCAALGCETGCPWDNAYALLENMGDQEAAQDWQKRHGGVGRVNGN